MYSGIAQARPELRRNGLNNAHHALELHYMFEIVDIMGDEFFKLMLQVLYIA